MMESSDEEGMAAVSLFEGHAEASSSPSLALVWRGHVDDGELSSDEEQMAAVSICEGHVDDAEIPGPWFQRGCRDLDAPFTDFVLTPMFQLSRDTRFLIHLGGKTVSYDSTSPAKKLELNPFSAEAVAECTYRLEASDDNVQYGTAFSVSPTVVLTAGHLIFMGSRKDFYTIINSIPAVDSMFRIARNTKGSLFKAEFFSTLSNLPKMTDPISKALYSAYGECMDAAALFLSQRAKYKGISLKRMENFLLPISLIDAIEQYGKEGSIAVGVCGFPMVSEFLKTVRSTKNADRHHIFQTYKLCFSSYWKQLCEEKINEAEKKMRLFNKMVEVLESTFQGFATGSMACSIGRVILYDDTAIASSYTCLPGSSGSPLVTVRGEVYPDYNLATSTDNLGFVIHHFQNVLPTLPAPSSFKEVDKRRLKAHCAWLWRHLNFILASKHEIMGGKDWGDEHASWFNFMLAQMDGAKRTLCIELTDAEVNKLTRRCKEIRTELFTMYNDCKRDETDCSIQDFETRLETVETIFALFQAIALKIRGEGLAVSAWGFPKKCVVRSVHALQKLALALE